MMFLLFPTRSSAAWPFLFAAVGTAGGLYLFYIGFRMLRFKRMILETPLSRIHSLSIGLVEVTGTPVGPYVLTAPITGEPCYYYRVRAWQWVEEEQKHYWKSVLDESLYVPFFLEDSTGRVLVNPESADLDVHKSFSDEISISFFYTPGLVPAKLKDFLVKRGLVPGDKIKLEEHIIPQGFPLFVFGTLGENTCMNAWSARPHQSNTLSDGSSVRFNFQTTMPTNVLSRVPGVQVQAASSPTAEDSSSVAVAERATAAINPPTTALRAGAPIGPAKPSTAKSNFGEFDLHPSVAIGKGERHEPFAISGHSQKELLGSLAWKSVACIWGGPLLTLICLYFLKIFLQWTL